MIARIRVAQHKAGTRSSRSAWVPICPCAPIMMYRSKMLRVPPACHYSMALMEKYIAPSIIAPLNS